MSTFDFTVGSFTYTVDGSYRYIGQQLSKLPVLSFNVKKLSEGNWYLFVNQNQFCGRYPSQAACLGVVYGMYTAKDGLDEGFAVFMADSLNSGSVIDPDVNIMSISNVYADPDNTTTITLDLYDAQAAIESSGAPNSLLQGIAYQTSSDGTTWSSQAGLQAITVSDGESQEHDYVNIAWSGTPENGYIRAVLVVFDSGAVPYIASVSAPLLKNEVDDTNLAFTVTVSGSTTIGDPLELGGYAHAVIDDSATVLDPGETVSYTYMWYREIPTLTGIDVTTS